MNDAIGIFIGLSALVGFIFFSWLAAEMCLFLLGLSAETVAYLLKKIKERKALKPSITSSMLFNNCKQADRECDKTNYASYIKNYVQSFKEGSRLLKIGKGRTIRGEKTYYQNTNHAEKDAHQLTSDDFPNVTYPPVENISKHSEANVSQVNGTSQPKGNDTKNHQTKCVSECWTNKI